METDVLKSYDYLEQELEAAKSNLKGLNDNIRRIIGRDPQDTQLRGDRKRNYNDIRRNNSDRQKPGDRDYSPIPDKRRTQETKSVFSRLSGPPSTRNDEQKPKIYSRVIRELPTRQEIVAAQGVDEESRARNRRMFGCLLGTLQKFCQEESRLKQKEEKKAKIEKKLEEQAIKEKENLKRERQILFSDRKREQLRIRKLELKMNLLKEFEIWEKSKKDLYNFIKTKTKPYIYFKPKLKLNDKLSKRLADCRAQLEKEIEKKRTALNEEILSIENRFKNLEDRISEKEDMVGEEENIGENVKHDRRIDNYDNDNENDEDDDDVNNDNDNEHSRSSYEEHSDNENNHHRVQIKTEPQDDHNEYGYKNKDDNYEKNVNQINTDESKHKPDNICKSEQIIEQINKKD